MIDLLRNMRLLMRNVEDDWVYNSGVDNAARIWSLQHIWIGPKNRRTWRLFRSLASNRQVDPLLLSGFDGVVSNRRLLEWLKVLNLGTLATGSVKFAQVSWKFGMGHSGFAYKQVKVGNRPTGCLQTAPQGVNLSGDLAVEERTAHLAGKEQAVTENEKTEDAKKEEKTIDELIAELPKHELKVDDEGWVLVETEDDLLSLLVDIRELFIHCEKIYGLDGFELIADVEGETLTAAGIGADQGLFFVDSVPGTHWYVNAWGVERYSSAERAAKDARLDDQEGPLPTRIDPKNPRTKDEVEQSLCALLALRQAHASS